MRQQAAAWQRIVEFVHTESPARICLQLGHAGRKGSTQLGWQQADHPLTSGNWRLWAPSPLPYLPGISQVPQEMTPAQMEAVQADFVRSAALGAAAGFDMLELHMAHGYLLASFLSPLTNVRKDEYGGAVENRLKYPLQVLRAVRAAWPADKARQRAHIRLRLGRRRLERSGCSRHSEGVGGGRRRYSRHFERSDSRGAASDLWPNVADALGRHGTQPRRRPHHCRWKYLRGRPRQFDHRGGPCGFMRDCAPASCESLVDAR